MIEIRNLSKKFEVCKENDKLSLYSCLLKNKRSRETVWALKNVSFDLKKGEVLGIIGKNGSGKTTLLKVLAGILSPTEGSISIKGKILPFIELGVGFESELTGIENIYLYGSILGLTKSEIDKKIEDVVHFADIYPFIHAKLKTYSSGMATRLAFSTALMVEPDTLLIDEVLSVGDEEFQRKCIKKMKELIEEGKTIVLVSHNLDYVREICQRCILLTNGEIEKNGNPEDVINYYLNKVCPKPIENKTESIDEEEEKRRRALKEHLRLKNCLKNHKKLIKNLNVKLNKRIALKEHIKLKKCLKAHKGMVNHLRNRLEKSLITTRESKKICFNLKKELTKHQMIVKRKDEQINILSTKLNLTNTRINPQIEEKFKKISGLKEKIKQIPDILLKNDMKRELKNVLCWIIISLEQEILFNERELKRGHNKELEDSTSRLKELKRGYKKKLISEIKKEKNALYSPIISRPVKISRVIFLNRNGEQTKFFKPSEKIIVSLKYNVIDEIENPAFGIRIYDSRGIAITDSNTLPYKLAKPLYRGQGEVKFKIENLILLGGEYLVSLTIFDSKSPKIYDHHEKAYYFKIKGEEQPELGFIDIKGEWIFKN